MSITLNIDKTTTGEYVMFQLAGARTPSARPHFHKQPMGARTSSQLSEMLRREGVPDATITAALRDLRSSRSVSLTFARPGI